MLLIYFLQKKVILKNFYDTKFREPYIIWSVYRIHFRSSHCRLVGLLVQGIKNYEVGLTFSGMIPILNVTKVCRLMENKYRYTGIRHELFFL
jgi:hypothetical protein